MEYLFKQREKQPILSGHLNLGGKNKDGEEITLNSKYLIRNGKPWMPIMGEIHFVRVKREDWKAELAKMKAAGITLVSTYMFWIYHEEDEGEFDFTDNRDIRAFIELCAELGLESVVRIGPWAHGECRNGGFPDWLMKKGFKLRENNSEYLRYARIWYEKLAEQMDGLYYKDGGPIVAVQLENELVDNAEHLLTLKKLAKECGIEVPIYTVTGWNSKYGAKIPVDEVLPVFGGYGEAPWDLSIEKRNPSPHCFFDTMRNDAAIGTDVIEQNTSPDGWRLPYERYPFATCELGSGIQVSHHRRPKMSAMDAYSLSLVKLGSGNNLPGYYMYHGGTNAIGKYSLLNEWDCPVLSYDFQAPIGEFGIVRPHCGLLNMLHLFIQDFGDKLAVMDTTLGDDVDLFDTRNLRYCMRSDGNKGFVFVNHYQRLTELADVCDIRFRVSDEFSFPDNGFDVKGNVSFFMPFNMDLEWTKLTYATAQPLCRDENTFFFAQIPGIDAEYKINGKVYNEQDFCIDNVRIITLTYNQAQKLRRLNGKVYIGCNCDIYVLDGKIVSAQSGSFEYDEWDGNKFIRHRENISFTEPEILIEDSAEPDIDNCYLDELHFDYERKIVWKKLTVKGDEGFVVIPYCGDVAQIYVDGVLTADEYWYNEPWKVPAKLLAGKEVYLGYSEMKNDFYYED